MLRSLYDRTLALAGSPAAPWWLALISFTESSFFPIPPDVLLIPMCLARPDRAWRFALICTISSVLGGVLGYFIGYAVFDQVARPILSAYGYGDKFAAYQAMYAEWGLLIILIKGVSPIPYKIVTIASGAASFDFWVFLAASIVTRGGRFFAVAAVMYYKGDAARDFIEKRLNLLAILLAAGIVGGFLALKYL